MRTSSTGGSNPRAPRLQPDAGVSLIEVMVVLALIGLMAGAVLLSTPGPERKAQVAVERFAASIAVASEESVIVNRPLALVVTAEGYGYSRLEPQGWFPIEDGAPLGFRRWPDLLEVAVEGAAAEAAATDAGRIARFDALGGSTPASLRLTRAGASWRVRIDGQGRAHVETLP